MFQRQLLSPTVPLFSQLRRGHHLAEEGGDGAAPSTNATRSPRRPTTESSSKTDRLKIERIADSAKFQAISRFRYEVYVEEMGRPQKDADHERKTIVDCLDDAESRLYGAWRGPNVVGTLRSNYLAHSDIGDYFDQYRLSDLSQRELECSSITTRLMVHRRDRKSTLAVRLACESFRHGLEDGILFDFIDCNSHLVPFFTGLGYKVHRDDLTHPEYGSVTVMRLNLGDVEHLERVKSPFRRVFRQRRER